MPIRNRTSEEDAALFKPILETGRGFYITVSILLAIVLWAVYAYLYQLRHGLGVTGLSRPVYWGIYIVNFVFFVGISHAGTLISAILRLCRAEWRRPITRSAEMITVLVLFFGVASIIMDMGRPDRLLYVIKYAHFTSPLLWDVTSITAYLTASTIYLYLPLIPDVALLMDRVSGWRKRLYTALALGWKGTEKQQRRLNLAIGIMAVLVIPIAVSVHTVVSWVFGMTIQPLWHSTIFGPYFVVGAIYSGIAALIVAMAVIRRVYHLEGYLKAIHFHNLGLLLLVMNLLWFYFVFAEHITVFYGKEPTHMRVFYEHLMGGYAPHFWTMVACMAAVFLTLTLPKLLAPVLAKIPVPALRPVPRLAIAAAAGFVVLAVSTGWGIVMAGEVGRVTRPLLYWTAVAFLVFLFFLSIPSLKANPVAQTVIASVFVTIGMWLERFTIVVPTLVNPRLPYPRGSYHPTWVEWSLLGGCVAMFLLLCVLFTKLFPIVSIWEVREGREVALKETEERIKMYLPDVSSWIREGGDET